MAMGNSEQKWTAEEEAALRAGVGKYGVGRWKDIQQDPEFNHILYSRSKIDLKVKWRARTPKPNVNTDSPATSLPIVLDGMTTEKYNVMIYEALSTLKDPNGSDACAIVTFIEKSHEVLPRNFRRLICARLRRLVTEGKLEKVQNRYRLGRELVYIPKPKEIRPRLSHVNSCLRGIFEEAAVAAAYIVAEAVNKSFVAAEAAKEAERLAELQLDKENS